MLLTVHTWRHSAWHWALLAVFGVSVLLLFRCLLYFPRLNQDRYLRGVFITGCVLLFMILGHMYGQAILGMQAVATVLFATRYYRYEP